MVHDPLVRSWITPASWLDHEPGWLPPAEAEALAAELRRTVAWERRAVVLFGREVLQPRLVGWAGERPYRYSGQTLEPRPFGPALDEVRRRVEARSGARFNHVLLNRYRDGHDSMGMHADDEPELGRAPTVASLSLGAARRFVIVARRASAAPRRTLLLEDGSLLVMGGDFQHELRHGVPKQGGEVGERISLTFRLVLADPGRPLAGNDPMA